jgi:glycine oxidase
MNISIVGAGLVGRTLSLMLLQRDDVAIELIDESPTLHSKLSCGYQAAGMVAPYAELSLNKKQLFDEGCESLSLWSKVLEALPKTTDKSNMECAEKIFSKNGTLILSHPNDYGDCAQLFHRIQHHTGSISSLIQPKSQLKHYESSLEPQRFSHHFMYLENEGHIHVPNFFSTTSNYLDAHPKVNFISAKIQNLKKELSTTGTLGSADYVIDTRGLGAKPDDTSLFGIRGEAILVSAPSVNLSHTIRLMHPRHPLYIVPRGNNQYYIGATAIESEDNSPISLKSTLELTSALYFIHEGFAESRILKTFAHSRPTYSQSMPKLTKQGNLIRLNGFYRHGYLLAPTYCQRLIEQYLP